MKKEIWKPVVGYEGLYKVSNWGRVKSMNYNHSGKERIMKLSPDKDGYLQLTLCKNNIKKVYKVHRLVAEAFLEIPEELKQYIGTAYLHINHKDENKQNNVVSNLEWCDSKYNTNYGTAIKRRSLKKKKPVLQYTMDGEFIREWASAMDAEREGDYSNSHIISVCKGTRPHHKNFIWKYK